MMNGICCGSGSLAPDLHVLFSIPYFKKLFSFFPTSLSLRAFSQVFPQESHRKAYPVLSFRMNLP